MVRVTGGRLCGRRLRAPPGTTVRPTADPVRESLFQIIGARLSGARVADCFAGTGALGIEALSRGATDCVFIEQQQSVAAVLRRNLLELGLEEQSRVLVGAIDRRLPALTRTMAGQLDWLFLDPPYSQPGIPELLPRLALLLAPTGRFVWEHPRGAVDPPPGWGIDDQRTYGRTQVTILGRAA